MRYNVFIIVVAIFSIFTGSCNLFDTRDPDPPNSSNETLPNPTSPDALLSNFISAFQQKNAVEYGKLFADTSVHSKQFQFIPNQSSASRYAVIFSTWNKTAEIEYFKKAIAAINSSSTPLVTFNNPSQLVLYQSDSAFYTANYTIFLPHSHSGLTQQFTGRCELYLAPDKNKVNWMIYRWTDFETSKDSSWSELKGQFSQ